MFSSSEGIFDVKELNTIRDAHINWCAAQSIEPGSPVGQEAVKMMLEAYRDGKREDELIAICDQFVQSRESHVRLGSPPIDSQSQDTNER